MIGVYVQICSSAQVFIASEVMFTRKIIILRLEAQARSPSVYYVCFCVHINVRCYFSLGVDCILKANEDKSIEPCRCVCVSEGVIFNYY